MSAVRTRAEEARGSLEARLLGGVLRAEQIPDDVIVAFDPSLFSPKYQPIARAVREVSVAQGTCHPGGVSEWLAQHGMPNETVYAVHRLYEVGAPAEELPMLIQRLTTLGADPAPVRPLVQSGSPPPLPAAAMIWPYSEVVELLSRTTEAPADLLFVTLTVCLGSLLGWRVEHFYARPIYANFFGVLFGPTALAKKSTALYWGEHLTTPEADGVMLLRGLGSVEALYDALQGKPSPRVLVYISELRTVLTAGLRPGTRNLLPELGNLYDLPLHPTLGTKGAKPLDHPWVSLLAAAPTGAVEGLLDVPAITGGFLNRCCIVEVGEPGVIPEPEEPDPRRVRKLQNDLQGLITFWSPGPNKIPVTSEAKEYWDEWYRTWRRELQRQPEEVNAVVGRTHLHARKLALLEAALKKRREITRQGLEWATSIAEVFSAHTLHLFGRVGLSRTARLEQNTMKTVRDHGQISRKDLQRALGGKVEAEAFHRITESLCRIGWLKVVQTRAVRGGQRIVYALGPEAPD